MFNARATKTWVVLGALVVCASAQAATLIALDLPELVRTSDHVVVAKAESKVSRRLDAQKLIVTDVTLRVVMSLKGGAKAGQTLVATVLGGAVGDVGLRVPGEASFPEGRSAVVFLRRDGKGLAVTGMSQGVMPITGDGAAAVVTPNNHDSQLMVRDAGGTLQPAPEGTVKPRALADLLDEIRRLASR